MTKTITLSDLKINQITIDYSGQLVHVKYSLVDNENAPWEKGEAIFWVTMPPNPTSADFQLPSNYIPTLLQLQADADAALTARFLV